MSNTLAADLSFKDITSGDNFSAIYYASAGLPQSLNGWSATAKIRSNRSSSTVILTLSNPGDIVLTADSSGIFTVYFTVANKATIMAALGSGVPGIWGLSFTDPLGNVYVPVEGAITITQSVPR